MATDDDLHWAAGQLDGDGSVGMYNGRLSVRLYKDSKSATTIQRFRKLFGGKVNSHGREHGTAKMVGWGVNAEEAKDFCARLLPYMRLKHPQFAIAASIAVGRSPCRVSSPEATHVCKTVAAASSIVGIHKDTLSRRFAHGNPVTVGQYEVLRLDKKALMQDHAEKAAMLCTLKHTPHDVSDVQMHPAYLAGFFDADGTVSLRGCRAEVTLVQKYPAVLEATQRQFGGHMIYVRGIWRLLFRKAETVAFLQAILPYAFEKAQQVQIALAVTPNSAVADCIALRALQGRYGKKT